MSSKKKLASHQRRTPHRHGLTGRQARGKGFGALPSLPLPSKGASPAAEQDVPRWTMHEGPLAVQGLTSPAAAAAAAAQASTAPSPPARVRELVREPQPLRALDIKPAPERKSSYGASCHRH